MTTLDKAIIADITVEGKNFEVYVDPEMANMYKEGQKPDLKNILVVDEVYFDAKKGERAKSDALQKAFGTTDIMGILEIILKKGNIQLTTDQKRKKVEEKYKQIVSIIMRETIDPRTNAPHTQSRIEEALEKAKFHPDPFKDARDQLPDILKKIRIIIPLKFEKMRIAVKIPPEHAQRTYGLVKSWGIIKEEWAKDGSLIVLVEIPSGAQGEFYDRVNKATAGNNETKVVEKI
ncbi:ribosome assembly factor SBDS [Candidatus Micrarchaeota archaeon]|nr:ribosome assembly factor SBDS [Candidatus Micrarchaeota archaeon]